MEYVWRHFRSLGRQTDFFSASVFKIFFTDVKDAARSAPSEYFGVRVVDSSSGRGIPAARVSVLHWLDQWSDSLGYVAFQEPALATPTQLFVTVESDNYQKLAVSLNASLGRSLSLQLRRQLPAERLYRVTGPGIFRDAVLLAPGQLAAEVPGRTTAT